MISRRYISSFWPEGDGSTLTLDFTTGILDPRLSFTRASDATFVNSSGFVQYAAANKFSNSIFTGASGTTAPTGWTFASIGGTGNLSLSGVELTISNNNSATRSRLYQNWGNSNGLPVTVQVRVIAKSGTFQLNELLAFSINSSTGDQYKVNGTNQSSAYTGWGAGDLITLTCTPAIGVAAWCVVGCGVSSNQATNLSVTIKDIQAEPGTVARSYIPTTTSGAYQAPRFDHDPTTLAPRGLLVEGAATNLLKHSQGLFTSWIQFGTVGALTTGITSPSGDSSAVSLNLNTAGNNGYYTNNTQMGYTNTVGATYTFSIWVRATGSTTNLNIRFGDSAAGYSANIPITTSWQRLQYQYVAIAASGPIIASATGTATGVVELWGAQLEAGSGASSYIPTGASQGTRNADSCVMTGTNFSSWFAGATEGVLYTQFEKPRSQSGTIGHDHASVGSQYGSGTGFSVYTAYNNYYPTTLLWPTGGAIFPGGIASAIPAVTKQAAKWFGGNDATNYANGVQGTTSTGTGTLTPNMLCIGAHSASGTAATRDWLNACVRTVKFWPVALPDSQIIALTTP